MARMRSELTVLYMHLIARGRNRKKVFKCDADRWDYLNLLLRYSKELGVKVLGWVLMDNHVHLLVACDDPSTAGELLRIVNGVHAQRFNRRHGRAGQVWSTRPKKESICFADYFRNCQLYIDLNPCRAGLVDDATEYDWSSCRFYCTGIADGLTTPSPWYIELGASDEARRAGYRSLIETERARNERLH